MRMYRLFIAAFLILTFSNIGFTQQPKAKRGGQEQNTKGKGRGGGGQAMGSAKKMNLDPIPNGNCLMGVPTDHSITASVVLENGTEAYVEYSTQSGEYKNRTSSFVAGAESPMEILINNLSPNSQYFYRLKYKLPNSTAFIATNESWFSTQKKSGTSFSFGVQGDSHPEREGKMFHPLLYKQTLDSVAAYKPDFYFMMGDDFNIDRFLSNPSLNKSAIKGSYQLQRKYLGNMGANPPLFLVNGNHEQSAKYLLDGTDTNVAVIAGNARKKYFPLPAPDAFYSGDKDTVEHVGLLKDYYAFEWGNALFVVLDPYWHSDVAVDNQPGSQEKQGKKDQWKITIGDAQYNWLKSTLEKSKAKFKFVFAHHVMGTGRGGVERAPFFEWGGKSPNGAQQFGQYRPGWALPIHQLMVKNKVTIFFQGHDHIYAQQSLDGVIYQSVPNPADDTHTAFNKEAYTSGKILPNSGFLHVSVGQKEVKVEYVRSYFKQENLAQETTERHVYTVK